MSIKVFFFSLNNKTKLVLRISRKNIPNMQIFNMRFLVAKKQYLDFVREKIWKNPVYTWNFPKHYFTKFSCASITFLKRLDIGSIPRQSLDIGNREQRSRPGLLFLLDTCAAHIGMDGIRIEKEPRQRDEYVYRIS